MKIFFGVLILAVGCAFAASVSMVSPANLPSGLPSEKTAKTILNFTPRHREWVSVPLNGANVLAFVVYPERSDKAPVVLVTARDQGASDWIRAVGDQVAAAGFIAVVPDVLTGLGPKSGDTDSFRNPAEVAAALARLGREQIARRMLAAKKYGLALPAANSQSARLELDTQQSTIEAAIDLPSGEKDRATFPLNEQGWSQALQHLTMQTSDKPVFAPHNDEHAAH